VGLAALLPFTADATVAARSLSVTGVGFVAVPPCLLVPVAWSFQSDRLRRLGYAVASGVSSGSASVLTQGVIHTGAPVSGTAILRGALALGLAALGLLLSQSAYRDDLGAPLAVLTLTDPITAAVIGLALLGERIRGGFLSAVLAALSAAVASRGVVLLARTGALDPAAEVHPRSPGSLLHPGSPAPTRRTEQANKDTPACAESISPFWLEPV
jgi:hypothetical protein